MKEIKFAKDARKYWTSVEERAQKVQLSHERQEKSEPKSERSEAHGAEQRESKPKNQMARSSE